MKYKHDLFISYSSHDSSKVRRLDRALRDRRFNIWLDESEIGVGETILKEILEGIKESRFLALWLSEHSVSSKWVSFEWLTMLHSEIEDGTTRVLPLLGEGCDIPLGLRGKKYIDFSGSFEEGLANLINFLDGESSVTIGKCAQGLIDGEQPSICAKELANIALRGRDELALQALWSSAQKTKRPLEVVDHCGWYIGRVVIESREPTLQSAGLEIIEDSIIDSSDIIVDKFAYTAGEIALLIQTPELKERIAHFVESCTQSEDPIVREWYTITKDRILEHDALFFEKLL